MATVSASTYTLAELVAHLAGHLASHPHLAEPVCIRQDYDRLALQLSGSAGQDALANWAASMTNVVWRADDFRDRAVGPSEWFVYAQGTAGTAPFEVWTTMPGSADDTSSGVELEMMRRTTTAAGAT
jgi:hypothetical protein